MQDKETRARAKGKNRQQEVTCYHCECKGHKKTNFKYCKKRQERKTNALDREKRDEKSDASTSFKDMEKEKANINSSIVKAL